MIAIVGGGIAGLFAARALARAGQQVTLFENDTSVVPEDADSAFTQWQRRGVAQLRQPHAARSIIPKLLKAHDPELLDALIAEGMVVWNFHLLGVQDADIGHDPELVGLLGRRPTFEIPLRRVVENTPGVTIVRKGVRNLLFEGEGAALKAVGVVTAEGPLRFDSVIEASGRSSRIPQWLKAAGVAIHEESSECGLTYFSRYFRFRPGVVVERGPYPSGPSASLPGVHFTMNRTDHDTFSLMLGVAPWRDEFRALGDEAVFMNFVRQLPGADAWLDPAKSEPIWRVEPFAGLVNRYRRFTQAGAPVAQNLYVIGDARFHTNPLQGWGMSFALQTSYLLADVFTLHADSTARLAAFEQAADLHASTYYRACVGEDNARTELWRHPEQAEERGEPGSYRYLLTTVLPAVFKDPWIFRKVTRRLHLLDAPDEILTDAEVLRRAALHGATLNRTFGAEQLARMAAAAAERHASVQA